MFVFQRLFQLLIIPRIMAIVVFTIYDMRCMISEKTSVLNCSQNHKFGDALTWIGAWLSMSILSSLMLIMVFILDDDFEFQKEKYKNIYKKGSFFSLVFLMLLTLMFYIIRIFPGTKIFQSVLFVLWVPITTTLVCVVNFVPRVMPQTQGSKEDREEEEYLVLPQTEGSEEGGEKKADGANGKGGKSKADGKNGESEACAANGASEVGIAFGEGEESGKSGECAAGGADEIGGCKKGLLKYRNISKFWFYWVAVLIYFFKVSIKFISVLLDTVQDLAPIVYAAIPEESVNFKGGILILLFCRLAFHVRILEFFYDKVFHGDKDLLSEPSDRLKDDGTNEKYKYVEKVENVKNVKKVEQQNIIELQDV